MGMRSELRDILRARLPTLNLPEPILRAAPDFLLNHLLAVHGGEEQVALFIPGIGEAQRRIDPYAMGMVGQTFIEERENGRAGGIRQVRGTGIRRSRAAEELYERAGLTRIEITEHAQALIAFQHPDTLANLMHGHHAQPMGLAHAGKQLGQAFIFLYIGNRRRRIPTAGPSPSHRLPNCPGGR